LSAVADTQAKQVHALPSSYHFHDNVYYNINIMYTQTLEQSQEDNEKLLLTYMYTVHHNFLVIYKWQPHSW